MGKHPFLVGRLLDSTNFCILCIKATRPYLLPPWLSSFEASAAAFQQLSTAGIRYSSGFNANEKSGNVGAVSITLQKTYTQTQRYYRSHNLVVQVLLVDHMKRGKSLLFISVKIAVYPHLARCILWYFLR